MLKMKKTGVTAAIQTTLIIIEDSKLPEINPLVKVTTCVRGRNAFAMICTKSGRVANGKNVPLNRNMGVISRKAG